MQYCPPDTCSPAHPPPNTLQFSRVRVGSGRHVIIKRAEGVSSVVTLNMQVRRVCPYAWVTTARHHAHITPVQGAHHNHGHSLLVCHPAVERAFSLPVCIIQSAKRLFWAGPHRLALWNERVSNIHLHLNTACPVPHRTHRALDDVVCRINSLGQRLGCSLLVATGTTLQSDCRVTGNGIRFGDLATSEQ